MKILFRGLGGAGQRHVRKFKEILGNNSKYYFKQGDWQPYLINSDFTSDKNIKAIDFYNLENLEESLSLGSGEKFYSVISTRTCDLFKEINEIKAISKRTLIEKPGFNSMEELMSLKSIDHEIYIGLQRRFSPLTAIYEDLINNSKEEINSISLRVKSNCKLWHPYQFTKDFYALNSNMGGGVLKTECHELISTFLFFENLELTNTNKYRKFDDSDVFTDLELNALIDDVELTADLSISSEELERSISVKTNSSIFEFDYISNSVKIINSSNKKLLKKLVYEEVDLFTLQALSFLSGDYKNSLIEVFDSLKLFSKLLQEI